MIYHTREREAGQLYSDGAKAVRSGGHELRDLGMAARCSAGTALPAGGFEREEIAQRV